MSNFTGIRQPQIQRVHLASSVRGSRCRCPRVRYVADFRTSPHVHPLENREEWCYQRGIQGRRGWLDDSRSPQLSAGTHGKTKPSATKKANPGRLTLWYWWWMGLPRQTLAPEKDEDALLGIRCSPWRAKQRRVVPGSREATGYPTCRRRPREHPNAASSHMGDRCVAATSLRCCGGTQADQDGRGTNELSKIESILGAWMSQNLSRDQRPACV